MAKRKDDPLSDGLVILILFALFILTIMFCGQAYLVYVMFTIPDAREILKEYGRDILGLLILSMTATTAGVVVIIRMLVAQIKDFPPGVLDQVMDQPDLKT